MDEMLIIILGSKQWELDFFHAQYSRDNCGMGGMHYKKGKSGEFGYFPQAINAQSTVNLVRVSF